jgi:hypothetical protein
MTGAEILALPIGVNDCDAKTIGEYLGKLLSTLWEEAEGFSGKRPFGNSGWQGPVEVALVRGGVVRGNIIEETYGCWLDDYDEPGAEAAVQLAIRAMWEGVR